MFCMYSSKIGQPRILYSISATAKGIMNCQAVCSINVIEVVVT